MVLLDFSAVDRAIAAGLQEVASALTLTDQPIAVRDSLAPLEFDADSKSFMLSWTNPDALLLHEGYTTTSGQVVEPERWTEAAIASIDVEAIYRGALDG